MTAVQGNFSQSPQALMHEALEKDKPYELSAMIAIISTIAAAAFGFLFAGLAGIAIGAGAGFLLAAVCVALFLPIEDDSDLLADPSICWIQGVPSALLAQQLAIGRTISNTQTVSFLEDIPTKHAIVIDGNPHQTFFLGDPTPMQRMHPTEIVTSLSNKKPFNLEKELQRAYMLPGDALTSDRTDTSCYLRELNMVIGRILQYGISYEKEQHLRQHLLETLLPIFNSMETLFAQLDQFPENRSYVRQTRARHASSSIAQTNDAFFLHMHRHKVNALCTLFDDVNTIDFNDLERDLIDHPCSLIFASTKPTIHPSYPLGLTTHTGQPTFIKMTRFKPLSLGEDLQYVYTEKEHMERVKTFMEPFGVEVRDLSTLCYSR